jgi:hypothetical protein
LIFVLNVILSKSRKPFKEVGMLNKINRIIGYENKETIINLFKEIRLIFIGGIAFDTLKNINKENEEELSKLPDTVFTKNDIHIFNKLWNSINHIKHQSLGGSIANSLRTFSHLNSKNYPSMFFPRFTTNSGSEEKLFYDFLTECNVFCYPIIPYNHNLGQISNSLGVKIIMGEKSKKMYPTPNVIPKENEDEFKKIAEERLKIFNLKRRNPKIFIVEGYEVNDGKFFNFLERILEIVIIGLDTVLLTLSANFIYDCDVDGKHSEIITKNIKNGKINIITGNNEEFQSFCNKIKVSNIKELGLKFPKLVLFETKGIDGISLHINNITIDSPSLMVEDVVNVTGCGDAAVGGLIYTINKIQLDRVSTEILKKMLSLCNALGGETCKTIESYLTREEIISSQVLSKIKGQLNDLIYDENK